MPRLPFLLIPLLLLAGCSSTAFVQQDLQHHHWVLSKLDGQPIKAPRDNPPDFEIGEHFTVNGIAGCNRYFGQGHLEDDKLWVTSLGSTEMACMPPLDTIEQAVLTTLTEGATLSGTSQNLILQGKQHRLEYTLRDWVF
ncbi:META domain-containing protein [Aeromonas veronii]|uniref:META domain-containing protein n=1 Tax=Aeromonas TaxID=642 RepID=UPI000C28F7B0|nr:MULTISPECIES: META domain-containing protein [Aeromonas]ATY75830.1 heat-shock protein HslJ [Aeromonas veronii]MBF3235782.1 META domain-containing protein [Aeromonas veronii]MCF5728385.1 META domain-containing protein [Aeromonas veronii]MCF5898998.1 META domain-containing protein [Aeromonas veronii]MCF5904117.1 META domain-containing protein [Aeromonas veronii]